MIIVIDFPRNKKSELWQWNVGLSIDDRQYQDSVFSDFDFRAIEINGGVSLYWSEDWRFRAKLAHENLTLGGQSFRQEDTVTPSVLWRNSIGRVRLEAEFSRWRYADALDKNRDGDGRHFIVEYQRDLLPDTLTALLAVEQERHNTDADALRAYDANFWALGVKWMINKDDKLALRYRHSSSDYDGGENVTVNNVTSFVARDESTARFTLSWEHSFDRHWTTMLRWIDSDRQSTLARYDYDRRRIEAMVYYEF